MFKLKKKNRKSARPDHVAKKYCIFLLEKKCQKFAARLDTILVSLLSRFN